MKEGETSKRISKCTGYSESQSEHQWGIASKLCEGKLKRSPCKQGLDAKEEPLEMEDAEINALENELPTLCLEEERLAKQRRKVALRKQIKEKGAKIAAATCSDSKGLEWQPATVKELRHLVLQDLRTPLEGILDPFQSQWHDEAQAASSGSLCNAIPGI